MHEAEGEAEAGRQVRGIQWAGEDHGDSRPRCVTLNIYTCDFSVQML